MSSSSEFSAVSGLKAAKWSEKPTFSQTCSLLSLYLKEKGSFGDLTLGITRTTTETNGSSETSCHSATTMDLFPTKESNDVKPQNLTTMDLLYPHGRYHSADEVPTLVNTSGFKPAGKEVKAAQLTIFYGGQVMVFDDFPAEKVEEIMSFAGKGVSHAHKKNFPAPSFTQTHHYLFQDNSQAPTSGPIVCDLPIARKASLHRFLEKRKDRIAAKAPYLINNPMSAPNKAAESRAWLGLGANSTL